MSEVGGIGTEQRVFDFFLHPPTIRCISDLRNQIQVNIYVYSKWRTKKEESETCRGCGYGMGRSWSRNARNAKRMQKRICMYAAGKHECKHT